MSKSEIKKQLKRSRERLFEILDTLSDEQLETPGVEGNWTIKDIIMHIMLWESEIIKLLWQAQQGLHPTTAHFAQQRNIDQINADWYEEHKDRPLDRVFPDFAGVRQQTLRRIDSFNDHDLNDAKRYAWLKGEPLWKWVADSSFAHEEKHIVEIRKWVASQ